MCEDVVQKKIYADNEIRSEGAHPLYVALSQRGLDPINLAYNPMSGGWLAQINSQHL